MEKRIQSIDGCVVISNIVILTVRDLEKLENPDLQDRINNIAKDMHVDWAVETSGNESSASISRTFGPVIGAEEIHDLDMATNSFMTAVYNIELPQTKDVQTSQLEKDLIFCKKVLDTFDESEEEFGIQGAILVCGPEGSPIQMECGRIGDRLLRKMFESFIKVHANE